MQLTKYEMEIMDILWENGALKKAEILSFPHSFTDSSVYVLLNGLIEKGAVNDGAPAKTGKPYGRLFFAAISRSQYWAQLIYSADYPASPISLIAEILKSAQVEPSSVEDVLELAWQRYFDDRKPKGHPDPKGLRGPISGCPHCGNLGIMYDPKTDTNSCECGWTDKEE